MTIVIHMILVAPQEENAEQETAPSTTAEEARAGL